MVLFGGNNNAYNITGWIYVTDFDLSNSMAGQWRAITDKFTRLDPELMYLTPFDSWEKLLPLCYLAKSLENMSLCHVVYFCKGWENARGCRIEHDAAVAYGLEVLYED